MKKLSRSLLILITSIMSVSLSAASATQSTDEKTSINNDSVLPMYAVIYGANEIELKLCTATGPAIPSSLNSWWTAVEKFVSENIENEKNLKAKADKLKAEMDKIVKKDDPDSKSRVEAIEQEISSVEASIEYLRGPKGRLLLAQNLIAATEASLKLNQIEDKENLAAYKKMIDVAIGKSMAIAGSACQNKITGCDVALKNIPAIRPVIKKLYDEAYVGYASSAEINFNMESLENETNNILSTIPKSKSAQYDWIAPLHEAFAAIKNARIKSGVICKVKSSSITEEDTVSFLNKLGLEKTDKVVALKTFKTHWDSTEKIIGQAKNRKDYFEDALKKFKEHVSNDEKQLNTFLATKTKLTNYMNEVKNSATLNHDKSEGVARAIANTKSGAGVNKNPSINQNIYALTNSDYSSYSTQSMKGLGKTSGAGGLSGNSSLAGASINGSTGGTSKAISTKLIPESEKINVTEKLSVSSANSSNDSIYEEISGAVSNLKTSNVSLKDGQLSFTEIIRSSPGEDGNKNIEIKPNETVVIDSNNMNVGELVINGTLICSNDVEQSIIRAKTIYVNGRFECGTPENRFTKKLIVLLKPNPALDPKTNPAYRGLIVNRNGVLNLYGGVERAGFYRLTQTVDPGATTLTLSSSVNWKAGDDIALAPTSYDPHQAERFTIKSVSGNVVTLNSEVRFRHWGETEKYNTQKGEVTLDQRAEVANLSRNIKIMADESDGAISEADAPGAQIGGHVMVHKGGQAYIDGAEFYKMGQAGIMARYPFHWHLVGEAPGQFIKNSSIHKSYQRCITVHGTNQTLVENNVCFDFKGHGYFFELGNEVNNVMRKNLGIYARYPTSTKFLLASDNPANSVDKRFPAVSTFWITNPQNVITDNISAGTVGSGFWMSFIPEVRAYNRSSGEFDGALLATPSTTNTTEFSNNIAHSGRTGMTWDGGAIQTPGREKYNNKNPNNPEDRLLDIVNYAPTFPPTFKNLTAYKNFESGIYFRGRTAIFDGGILADNGWGFFLAFNQIVKNFAIIGESKNNGSFEQKFIEADRYFAWRQVGMVFYDGPLEADTIDFINFPDKQVNVSMNGFNFEKTNVPFLAILGNEKYTNIVSNLKFSPEPYHRVYADVTSPTQSKGWVEEGNANAVRDLDGSLTGTPGGLLLASSNYGSHPGCEQKSFNGNPSFNTFKVCPPQTSTTMLWIATPDLPGTPYLLKRSDGEVSYKMSEWSFLDQFAQTNKSPFLAKNRMISSPEYTYELLLKDRFSSGQIQIGSHMEKPNELSPVFKLAGFGKECSINGVRASDSYSAFKAAQENAYFSDGADFYFKQKSETLFNEVIPNQFGKTQESDAKSLRISCAKRIENRITGYIDNVVEKNGELVVNGWACDYGKDAQIDLHVYVGGAAGSAGSTMIGAATANELSEPAVSFACGDPSGKTHRFTYKAAGDTLTNNKGKKIYVHGLSVSGKENRAIAGSGNFTIGGGSSYTGPRPASEPEVLPNEGVFCSFKHEVSFKCNPGVELKSPWVSVGNGCYHKDNGETEKCK